jgi:uncharacterized membrane protein YdbT with pleckstrin-like domain
MIDRKYERYLVKQISALKIIIVFLIALLSIFIFSIEPTIHYIKKQNNKEWQKELIRRGIMQKTKNGVRFNKVFTIKIRD